MAWLRNVAWGIDWTNRLAAFACHALLPSSPA